MRPIIASSEAPFSIFLITIYNTAAMRLIFANLAAKDLSAFMVCRL